MRDVQPCAPPLRAPPLLPSAAQRVIDAFQMEQCLIFCRTNFDCDNLEKFLNSLGERAHCRLWAACVRGRYWRAGA